MENPPNAERAALTRGIFGGAMVRRAACAGVVAAGLLLAGVTVAGRDGGDGSPTASAGPPPARLECGSDGEGSKAAFRRFAAILRGGDETQIRSVLVEQPRFAWISAHDAEGPDISIRDDPDKAARKVAVRGGLPMEITHFSNVERPSRTTDAGFTGRWDGDRRFIGKGALDCGRGKAIVLSVGVPPVPHPRCPDRARSALPLGPSAGATTREVALRDYGPETTAKAKLASEDAAGCGGYVVHTCGGRVARRTVVVYTWDHRFDHGRNKSASLGQGVVLISRFADGYREWYRLH